MSTNQITLGSVLVHRAVRCWDLTAAVPMEFEASLWAEGDSTMRAAALFGDDDALRWVAEDTARRDDRSCDQKCFYEMSAGF